MTPTLGDAPPPHESPLEPRFFARVVAELPVAVIVPSGPVRGVACDLSEGGIGVALDAPMVVGTLVELVVWLHGSSAPPIRPICHVAWNRHEEGKARVGFELYEISDDDAAALRDYLAQHEAAQVTEHESEPGDSTLPPSVARQYVPLVRSIALGLCRKLPSSIQVDDLIGAGFVGLVEAYRRHDASDETGFKVYAERRILGAMLDELRSLDPLSRGLRDLVRRANTTRRRAHPRARPSPHAGGGGRTPGSRHGDPRRRRLCLGGQLVRQEPGE
jgi:hypothetical protein